MATLRGGVRFVRFGQYSVGWEKPRPVGDAQKGGGPRWPGDGEVFWW